jgi:hypothetical protein
MQHKILTRLKDLPILESFSGELTSPSKLMYVEERFLDHTGEPLCSSEHTRSAYLSRNYPRHLKDILCSLGVEDLSNEKFVDHFEQMVSKDEARFHAKTDEWHSEVARTLLSLIEDGGLKEKLRRLPIVPLSNGKWVSATSEPRMFQEQSILGDVQVLRSLRIIHPAAMKNGNRRSLWSSLDIKPIDRQEICQYIVGAHENPVVDPMLWTRAQLVAHARFLYSSEWRPSRAVDLWVESSQAQLLRSSEAYYLTDTDRDEPTTRVFKAMQFMFHVLHDDYLLSNTASEDVNESTSEKSNEDSAESGSPKSTHSFEGVADVQRVAHPIFEEGDHSHSGIFGNNLESETEERSENSYEDSESSSSESTHYLEDIADMQRVAYPISEPGFREFLEWKSLKKDWDCMLQSKSHRDETSASGDEDDWLSYLKDVLQVATLPRMAQTSPLQKDRGSLKMSRDFKSLLKFCDVSDVLHVLLSNWHHYAHLIEPRGTGDDSEEEKLRWLRDALWHRGDEAESLDDSSPYEPNATLIRELRWKQVNIGTTKAPLEYCALPNLDPRFDEDPDIRLPTLDLKNFSKDERQRLKYLMVSVEADTRYYLKCLNQVRGKAAPPHGTLKQLYEEIQSRYDEDEGLIR